MQDDQTKPVDDRPRSSSSKLRLLAVRAMNAPISLSVTDIRELAAALLSFIGETNSKKAID